MNLKENISLANWNHIIKPVDASKLILAMFFLMALLLIIYILLSVKENS